MLPPGVSIIKKGTFGIAENIFEYPAFKVLNQGTDGNSPIGEYEAKLELKYKDSVVCDSSLIISKLNLNKNNYYSWNYKKFTYYSDYDKYDTSQILECTGTWQDNKNRTITLFINESNFNHSYDNTTEHSPIAFTSPFYVNEKMAIMEMEKQIISNIVLNKNMNPNIIYYSNTNAMKFAHKSPGNWETSTIDPIWI
ncbi:hypothetical protein HZA55_03390 [Candidatus Poribacteria bacterium]|nr:hypothetical protein [Candidatus Poribacteria bacterium]